MGIKKLPVGIDGFEKIRKNNFYYIDKTGFIAELLQNWGEVNLFTRPRRFGKSLNMSMLKNFFEIGCDKSLFDGLKIMGEEKLCEEYMGQFPVISISLKSVDGLNFEAAAAAFRTVIGVEATRFQFLKTSDKLSEGEKSAYLQLVETGTAENGIFTMNDEAMTASLKTLSRLLAKHYGRKAVLLIDEYDVPLDKAFQAGYYEKMVSLIRNLFGNALKTNEDLQFAALTGCLRISKESIFTGLNNLNVMTVSDPYFCDSFGFTDREVRELLEYYGLGSAYDTVKDWYDGYQFGDVSIYCPWDVIKYAQILIRDREAEPENYWANTSGNDLVRRLIGQADKNTKEEIEELINGGTIAKNIRQELTYRDIEDSVENVWSVLYSTGYLTKRGRLSGKQMKLTIPNKEVRELFIDLVKDWFAETTREDGPRIEKFCRAFPDGDAVQISKMLQEYLWDSISIRDTAVRKDRKENFYHGMLLGLLQSQSNWLVRSNEELGDGYGDISICTPDKTGIVIEIKYAADGNLEKSCKAALEQIRDKKYDEGLKRRGMKKILRYGIAFWEKDCMAIIEK